MSRELKDSWVDHIAEGNELLPLEGPAAAREIKLKASQRRVFKSARDAPNDLSRAHLNFN
jgi:hypothetical protein